jgi:hypothetical protein
MPDNNPWQVVSETPAQSQSAPAQPQPSPTSNAQSSPWTITGESPAQPQPKPDASTWAWIKDKLSEVFNPNDERNLHPKEVSAGAIARGADFDPATQTIYNAGDHSAVIRGAEKGFTQTLSGTSHLAGKAADKLGLRHKSLTDLVTDNGQPKGIFGEAPASDVETKPEGVAEHVGFISENLMEFIAGDEALKSLSLAQKLGVAVKIAKLSETSPTAAKLISAGLRATRTGAVSGAQEAAHGGSTSDVATAGGTGFLSSVGSEGLGALAKLARPGVKEIANESLKTSPAWKGAGTAAKLAAENQEPAQRVISNVAKDSAQSVLDKFGKTAPDTISSFGDAAKEVQAAAKPTFMKLDELSNGQFAVARNELANATKVARRATSVADLEAAEKAAATAQGKIDDIISKSAGKIAPADLDNAKSAWRASKTLEALHGKIDAAYSAPQAATEISGASRTLELPKLQGKLNAAFKTIPQADLHAVIGKEGTANLYSLAQLGADPLKAKSLSDVAHAIGEHLGIGGAGLAAGALVGHAVPGGSAALGIHFLYAHPDIGQYVAKALSKGTNPKLIVPGVLQILDSQRQQDQSQ